MAASSSTTGQRNDSDGLRTVQPTSAFDAIIPAASTFVASSSGTKHTPYDVFINHCGKDAKHTLASRIYAPLDSAGLRVFLDKDELKLGDLLLKALEEAMATASIYIAIFSKHYAQSPWCLAELEFMVKSRKTIIPVFYHVDPCDLRWVDGKKGTYAEAFLEHEKKNRYNTQVLQGWKKSLHEVSFCIGEIIRNNDDEHRVVKKVVNLVMNKMSKVPLEVAKFPVGLDEAVQNFNTFALQSAGSTSIVGIWGMGGSGKTALAKEIFNRRRSAMDESSFLFDLRDAAGKGQLVEKQQKLLQDLKVNGVFFDHVDFGKVILNSRLRSLSVLIVLDDVDHIDQLDALLPPKESLGDGSLIIVTTRNADVLRQWGISAIYQMRPLNATHAKQLFCWHAFLQNSPPLEFEDLAEKFLNACLGLPLSLKVLGGQLYGRSDKNYWQRTFNKFSRIPHEDIAKKLKVSYDALGKQDKEMFLDTACLFIGRRKSAAIAAWDAEWDGLLGWETLFNKCLVEEDGDGLIRMHDHLRDLGRDIANGHSPHRLWSPQQVIEITPEQQAIQVRGMGNAIGDNCYQGKIIIHTTQGERSLTPCSLRPKIFVGNGDFINQEHCEISGELLWLQYNEFKHRNLPSWVSLKKLRILEFQDGRRLKDLWESDADAPLQLRELVIGGSIRLQGIPKSIGRLKYLKKISIDGIYGRWDTLTRLPQEFCRLQSLEHLEIKGCSNLSSLPSNFGELTNLQHLDLRQCSKLKSLPDSSKKLTLLDYLNLERCWQLIINSELHILENMTKLRYLSLERCSKLEELHLPEVASLTKLNLTGTSLKELPANIFQQTKLTELEIGSNFLTTLPSSLENLSSLTTFKIKRCRNLESFPDSLKHLNLLRDLTIQGSGMKCLPKSLIHLQSLTIGSTPISELSFGSGCMLKRIDLYDTKVSKVSICGDCCPFLETLNLQNNDDLKELETLPATLKTIYVKNCNVLKDIRGVSGLENLQNLQINNCEELDGLPCFAELASLEILELRGTRKVKKIEGLQELRSLRRLSIELDVLPSFAEFTSLKEFELQRCNKLEMVQRLEHLKSLEKLTIRECRELDGLPCFAEFTSLKKLKLHRCNKLEKIRSLEHLKSLEMLTISECRELDGLPCFVEFTTLKIFELQSCYKLEKIQSLEHLKSLKMLNISYCPELEGLPGLAKLTSLNDLKLDCCHKLKKMEDLESITSLEILRIYDCSELEGLPNLAELTLQKIELRGCRKLKKIEGLGNLRVLKELDISECSELEALPNLKENISLKIFQLQICHELKKIEGLGNISLVKLRICDCPELDRLPSLAELTSLETFELHKCHKLKKIEGLDYLRSLEELIITDCSELEGLPSLAELTSLTKLGMCHKSEKIEGLGNQRFLKDLIISDCPELKALPSLQEAISLKYIHLRKCHMLEKTEGLENIISLERLRICDCPELDRLPSLAKLTSLKSFDLRMCHKLKQIEGLENIRSLEYFYISDCPGLEALLSLPKIASLKKFQLRKCHKLEKIKGLENIRSVEELRLHDCSELDGLPGLAELTSLKEFDLRNCPKLKKIEGLENIKSLKKLRVHGFSELDWFAGLAEFTSLEEFDLEMCPKLKKLEFLENIESLKKLKISDCPELEALPSLPELTSLELDLRNCHKLEKIEGLERLRFLKELELHNRWNAPCIVSLEHSERLRSLVVVANHISAVEPIVSSIQKWPRQVMICTRAWCDVDSLKNFFEELPSVSVLDYSHVVEVGHNGQKHLELRRPASSDNAILICLTIDCVYLDLSFSPNFRFCYVKFNSELGEGKWVWMGVFTQLLDYCYAKDCIFARNSKGEDVKVKVEAAWLVTGEHESIVEAFRKYCSNSM